MNPRRFAWLALMLSCTTTGAPSPRADSLLVIERDPGGRMWLATWHLVEPTAELRFERPANGFRADLFEVLTPGFRMVREGDTELLRTDGAPAREIRVRFPEYDRPMVREYEFFRRFTDGGVAIFTGHLVALPSIGAGERSPVATFRFVPPAGSAVVLAGKRSGTAVEWTDAEGRGTYAYIGPAAPVASDDVISIIDPGLPEWLERSTSTALPRIFAILRERLDAEPAGRPVVLFDYTEGSATGYSNGGGTLPGLIQLSAEGRAWQTESRPAMLQLVHFLAHEAVHVWNGEIAHYPGTADAWMHEGGADALAQRILTDLGVIDEAAFLEYQTEALNDCRSGLLATTLRRSAGEGRPRLAYTCGNIIALLTEATLAAGGQNLFDFWRALIAHAVDNGGEYHADDYVSVWRGLGGTTADMDALDGFLDGTMTPAGLDEALRARGVRVVATDPPASYGLAVAREAMMALMREDCGGRVGFRSTPSAFVLDNDVECRALPAGASVRGFGGNRLDGEGHLAYDHVRQRCAAGGPVQVDLVVGGDGIERSVACTIDIPERPAYVSVAARPAKPTGTGSDR